MNVDAHFLLQFIVNPDMEDTNNAARGSGLSALYMKVSGESRSNYRSMIYTGIFSNYYTLKLRGNNFISNTHLSWKERPDMDNGSGTTENQVINLHNAYKE